MRAVAHETVSGRTRFLANPTRRTQAAFWIPVSCAAVLNFVLGCYRLGARSIWGDEGATYVIASQHGAALGRAIARDGGNLALYYLCMHVVLDVFGHGTDIMRLPSVFAAAALVVAVGLLGRRFAGPRCGVFAAVLASLCVPVIYWGQMARGYTFAALFATLSTLAFVNALETRATHWFVAYVFVDLLLCYTIVLGVLVVGAQLLALGLSPTAKISVRKFGLAIGSLALLLVPLAFLVTSRGGGQLYWLGPPNTYQVTSVATFLAGARAAFLTTSTSHLLTIITVGLVIAAILLVPLEHLRFGRTRATWLLGLCIAWLLFPPSFAYLVSRNFQPVFLDRYFEICLPASCLVLALIFDRIGPARLGVVCWGALVLLRGAQIPSTYGHSIDDWHDATNVVMASAHPGDCIGFYANDGRVDFAYYLSAIPHSLLSEHPPPRPVLPAAPWSQNPAIIEQDHTLSPAQFRTTVKSCPRIFLVAAHVGHDFGTPSSRATYDRFVDLRGRLAAAYPVEQIRHVGGSITVFLFSKTSPIPKSEVST